MVSNSGALVPVVAGTISPVILYPQPKKSIVGICYPSGYYIASDLSLGGTKSRGLPNHRDTIPNLLGETYGSEEGSGDQQMMPELFNEAFSAKAMQQKP